MKFQTFLINMKKNPDRLIFMSEQFKNIDIKYTLQEGVDGQTYDFSKDYDDSLSKEKNAGKSMTRGHIGCSLSHKKIFEKIISENIDYALVIEDDVELPLNFKQIIDRELLRRWTNKTKWDYLSFNYPSTGWLAVNSRLYSLGKESKEVFYKKRSYLKLMVYYLKSMVIIPMYVFEGIRESIHKIIYKNGKACVFYRPLYLTGCYLISRDGSKKLLAVNNKIIYEADRLPNVARIKTGLRFYAFTPLLVTQKKCFESTTGN